MTLPDHPFTAAADPRNKDCIRCGRPHKPSQAIAYTERTALLTEGEELCQRVFGQPASPTFARRVAARLLIKAPHRSCESVLDKAAGAILDYERRELPDVERDELRQATLAVIAVAVRFDVELHNLMEIRRDLFGPDG